MIPMRRLFVPVLFICVICLHVPLVQILLVPVLVGCGVFVGCGRGHLTRLRRSGIFCGAVRVVMRIVMRVVMRVVLDCALPGCVFLGRLLGACVYVGHDRLMHFHISSRIPSRIGR